MNSLSRARASALLRFNLPITRSCRSLNVTAPSYLQLFVRLEDPGLALGFLLGALPDNPLQHLVDVAELAIKFDALVQLRPRPLQVHPAILIPLHLDLPRVIPPG